MDDIYVAVVCSSNMNRSMEAHAFLAKRGFKVKSYGTGDKVRLPGLTQDKPNIYDFGISYESIYQELSKKDKSYYTCIGVLSMLDRNRRIKLCPEKLQNSTELFDVIITCEKRVYDQVIEHFETNQPVYNQPVHIVNLDIPDNHEEATIGAFLITDMVSEMSLCEDLDDIDILLQRFEIRTHRPVLNSVMFY